MLWKRSLAVLCGVCGCLCLLAAIESVGGAVECSPQDYSPAECQHAHEEANLDQPTNSTCVRDEREYCVPAGESICDTDLGWGIVVAGRCRHQEDLGSTPKICTRDYGVTVVTLHRWRADCIDLGDSCSCYIYPDYQSGSSDVQVCDCRQREL